MIVRILSCISLAASIAVAQQGVPSSVKFCVRDDTGAPASNAAVEGCFLDVSASGARDQFRGFTDTNGVFRANGEALIGVYARMVSPGHYPATVNQSIKVAPSKGRKGWIQPRYELEIPVLLKRIRNPITGYIRRVEDPYVDLWEGPGKYRLAQTSSFDLVKGVFAQPHGKGDVADVAFNWRMRIYSKDGDGLAVDYDTLCDIRMTNTVDGIRRGTPDGSEDGSVGSAFISAYDAPLEGYTNTLSFYRRVRGAKAESNDDQHYLYYFRIRTQTNAMGQVTNALYGKIYGQINGNFTYYLNPTPNDRNVEFDTKRNLTR